MQLRGLRNLKKSEGYNGGIASNIFNCLLEIELTKGNSENMSSD